jgi:hypothetical protein
VWGFAALTHGEPLPERPTPPAAPSVVYPSQGFAMLRSDETPRYWTAGGTAAVLRLGGLVGHGHKDYYHLILHGKGRLLYPDLNVIQYEPTYLNWTHEGIAHNTLLVDHQSPRPGPFTTRQDFGPGAKFFAISGSAYEGVTQTRALLLTPEYLADVFRAADTEGRPRTFDWALHGLGRLYPGNPAAYRPTQALLPHYWWVDHERGRSTDGDWQADWVQHGAGVAPGAQAFGKEWFEGTAGVRLRMLGAPGTEVYTGEGPLADGPPYHRLEGNPEGSSPLVVARRRAPATTFVAVHEPYEKRPALPGMRRIQETDGAVGLAVEGGAWSDRVLIAFDDAKDYTLSAGGEAFTFRGYGYVRRAGDRVTVRGGVKGLRLAPAGTGKVSLTINGKEQAVRRSGNFVVFGDLPPDVAKNPGAPLAGRDEAETRAAVHYSFLPEEVHLRAGGTGETAVRLRIVGSGEAEGRLRLAAPKGLTVTPDAIDVGGMKEGDEKVVRLRLKCAAGTAAGLYRVRVSPEPYGRAAAGELVVSVGVVLTTDNRVPMFAQTVVRAPGYTMRVDQVGGVAYSLLDADGNRRHGMIHNTNFCNGIPALESGGKWAFRYRLPCRFVWDGKNTLTVGSGADGESARLRYTFHEDRMVFALVAPTDPRREYRMWLGNFDALGPPRHDGTAKRPHEPIEVSWLFFPHPRHRQGVLLRLPGKVPAMNRGSAVHFPIRAGQQAELRFATAEELAELVKEKQSASR